MKGQRNTAAVIILLLILIGSFIFFYNRNNNTSNESVKENVSVRLKWFNQAQFSGYYVAQSKGLYEEAGLNVTLNPGGPNISQIQLVASGTDQLGITSGNQIILARDKGIPVVAVAVIYEKSPIAIVSFKEKNITNPTDLIGKKIGIVFGDDDEVIYKALLKNQGINEIQINAQQKTFDLSQLISGQTDAEGVYEMNEPYLLQQKGYDINIMKPRDYGINFYGDTLFTTEDMIKNHPETVRKFVQATVEGWNLALNDKDYAITQVLEKDSTLDKGQQTFFLNASEPLISNPEGIGLSNKSTWEEMKRILVEQNYIENDLDIDSVFTNEFLK
jgi:ABC-type nitrate/sulfonate/bicarbonate transport system substrate-binding protein